MEDKNAEARKPIKVFQSFLARYDSPGAQDRLMRAAVFFLFALSVVVRGLILVGPHVMTTYYDEILSWGLAKTFWNEPAFSLYFLPVNFSKFVYSLVLSPLFLIKDSLLRSALAIWLNKVMISFSVFPAYRLAKKITASRRLQLLALVLFLCSPIMNYADKYTQESLYLPLCLYLILGYYALFKRIHESEKCSMLRLNIISALLGVFACVIYYEKEAVTAFLGAFLIGCLVLSVKYGRKKDAAWKRYLIAAAVHAAAAGACYLLIKLILGLGFSYSNQVGVSNIDSMYKIEYLIRCIVSNWLYVCAAFFGMPVLYWQIKKNRQGKLAEEGTVHCNWVVFLYIAFGLTLFFLSYSVTVREELGKNNLRIHTRYFIPFLFPFFMLTLEEMRKPSDRARRAGVMAALILGVACVLLMPVHRYVSAFDSYEINHIQDISQAFDDLSGEKGDLEEKAKEDGAGWDTSLKLFFADQTDGSKEVTYNHGLFLFTAAFAVFLVGIVLLTHRNKKIAVAAFCVIVLAVEGYNNVTSVSRNELARRPDDDVANYAALEQVVTECTDGSNLLVISSAKLDAKKRRMETFFSFDWYAVLTSDLNKALGENGVIDLNSTQLLSCMTQFMPDRKYPLGLEIRYVLCTDDVLLNLDSANILYADIRTGYNLYQLYDTTRLDVDYIKDYYDELAAP